MKRIAIAGFQHETNSFSGNPTVLDDFLIADSWPELLTGDEVVSRTFGMNIPIAGFAAAALADGVALAPILWCAAEPAGPVTDHAFDHLAGRILDGVRAAGALDGIYLDLHGAMITESLDDGESELLSRLRHLVGPDLPIAVSLDLHANISAPMVQLADVICIFRTYPHLDMAATGARCWRRLRRRLAGARLARAFRQAPFLIPPHAQHTGASPARELYAGLPDAAGAHVELALGFTASDIPDCGPSIVAFAPDEETAGTLASRTLDDLCRAEPDFDTAMASPLDAVAQATRHKGARPVVLADVQDNPGAGASSDTTGLLSALVHARAQGVLLGLMHDPEFAARAHRLGPGAVFGAAMGGRSGVAGDSPFHGTFEVLALSDGWCRYTGEMYRGGVAKLGPACSVRITGTGADVTVVVTSQRNQCLDRAHFTHFGLDPERARILCVKSTAHFRADFEPICDRVIAVAAPGSFPCDLATIPYRRLRGSVRPPAPGLAANGRSARN